jgi:hypothetical protein
MAKPIEVTVAKFINDLKGIDDVLYEPRSWSPESLKEACDNLRFDAPEGLISTRPEFEFEFIVLQFLFRKFFYIQHQTGLYNPQRKLWSLIAQTNKIKIKDYKRISRKDRVHTKITDLILEDISGKFIKVRLVHPGSELHFPGFRSLIGNIPGKCLGIFYISDQVVDEKTLNLIKTKTNASDFFDKYRSPITKNCSFNLVKYAQLSSGSYKFSLIHPDLGKDVEVEVSSCFVPS